MNGITDALAAARDAVDGLLADEDLACTVTITADPEGAADDVLDEVTLELRPAVGDTTPVYVGPALISAATTRQEPGVEGGAATYPIEVVCKLPTTAAPIRIGHRVHIDTAPNPSLVGQDYLVDEVPTRGIEVTRLFTLRHTVRGPRR